MELAGALILFAITLVGLQPDKTYDGWTMLRDRTFVVFIIIGLIVLAQEYLAFAIIFALVLSRFGQKSSRREVIASRLGYQLDLHALCLWGMIFLVWIFFQSLNQHAIELAITGLLLAGVTQFCFTVVDWINTKVYPNANLPISGTLGQKTYLACYFAIIAPITANRHLWPLLVMFFIGILLTKTRIPLIIFTIGVIFASPVVGLMFAFAALCVLPLIFDQLPSFRKDSLPIRMQVWRLTWEYGKQWPFWLIGRGHNSFSWHSLRWSMQYNLKEAYVHTHNDYLQFFFEYGLVGLAAIAIFAFPVLGQLRVGHGMSGSVIAIALCSAYNFPNHIAPIGVTILFLISTLLKGAI